MPYNSAFFYSPSSYAYSGGHAYGQALFYAGNNRIYLIPQDICNFVLGGAPGNIYWDYLDTAFSPTYKVQYLVGNSTAMNIVANAYRGGVLVGNRIYLIPYGQANQSNWHYINAATATVTSYVHGLGASTPVQYAYKGGVYDSVHNRIWLVPYAQGPRANWHYINTLTGAVVSYAHSLTVPNRPVATGYNGGAFDTASGRAYLAPAGQCSNNNWHYINTNTTTATRYAHGLGAYTPLANGYGDDKYPVAVGNRLYLMPYNQAASTYWHYIVLTTGVVSYYIHGGGAFTAAMYRGGVYVAESNRIYFIPYNRLLSTDVWHYLDVATNTMSSFVPGLTGLNVPASDAYAGGVLDSEKKMWFVPSNQYYYPVGAPIWHGILTVQALTRESSFNTAITGSSLTRITASSRTVTENVVYSEDQELLNSVIRSDDIAVIALITLNRVTVSSRLADDIYLNTVKDLLSVNTDSVREEINAVTATETCVKAFDVSRSNGINVVTGEITSKIVEFIRLDNLVLDALVPCFRSVTSDVISTNLITATLTGSRTYGYIRLKTDTATTLISILTVKDFSRRTTVLAVIDIEIVLNNSQKRIANELIIDVSTIVRGTETNRFNEDLAATGTTTQFRSQRVKLVVYEMFYYIVESNTAAEFKSIKNRERIWYTITNEKEVMFSRSKGEVPVTGSSASRTLETDIAYAVDAITTDSAETAKTVVLNSLISVISDLTALRTSTSNRSGLMTVTTSSTETAVKGHYRQITDTAVITDSHELPYNFNQQRAVFEQRIITLTPVTNMGYNFSDDLAITVLLTERRSQTVYMLNSSNLVVGEIKTGSKGYHRNVSDHTYEVNCYWRRFTTSGRYSNVVGIVGDNTQRASNSVRIASDEMVVNGSLTVLIFQQRIELSSVTITMTAPRSCSSFRSSNEQVNALISSELGMALTTNLVAITFSNISLETNQTRIANDQVSCSIVLSKSREYFIEEQSVINASDSHDFPYNFDQQRNSSNLVVVSSNTFRSCVQTRFNDVGAGVEEFTIRGTAFEHRDLVTSNTSLEKEVVFNKEVSENAVITIINNYAHWIWPYEIAHVTDTVTCQVTTAISGSATYDPVTRIAAITVGLPTLSGLAFRKPASDVVLTLVHGLKTFEFTANQVNSDNCWELKVIMANIWDTAFKVVVSGGCRTGALVLSAVAVETRVPNQLNPL